VKRRQKAGFLKREEKKNKTKQWLLLVFIIATLEITLKKLLDAKGPFGDNVIKNPARYIIIQEIPTFF